MVENPERPVAGPERTVADVAAVRRAPRYRAFVSVGAMALATLAAVAVLALGDGPASGAVLALLAGGAAVLGGLLGALVAVLLDRTPSH